jgi:dihydrofolate reductase
MMARKLVYAVAVSVDHYIAHEDGGIGGFLMEGAHVQDYLNSLRAYDTVLMGKNTYEWGYQFGLQAGQAVPTYGHMQQYVFSQSMAAYAGPQLQVVRDEPAGFVRGLKTHPGKDIYLCGGGQLAGHLLGHNLVDEVIFKMNPVLFGKGISAFALLATPRPLHLLDVKTYNNGVVLLHYRVE